MGQFCARRAGVRHGGGFGRLAVDARVNESFAVTTSPASADVHHLCARPGAVVCYRIAPMRQPPTPAIMMPAMPFLAAGVPGSGEWKAQMPMLALTSKLS